MLLGAEKEVTIRSFKSYIEFLKFFQKNLSKESMNELLKHNKILLNIYQKYKERTMKQQLYKLRQSWVNKILITEIHIIQDRRCIVLSGVGNVNYQAPNVIIYICFGIVEGRYI